MNIKRRLDKSRSAGSIHPPMPHPENPTAVAHYEQDGFHFDHEGKLLVDFLTPEQRKQFEPSPAPKPPKPAQDGAGGEQEQEDEVETDDDDAQPKRAPKSPPKTHRQKLAEKQKPKTSGDNLNLESWLRGEEKYQEFRVKKVVRERYNRVCTSTKEMVRFLVDDVNLVPKEALKPEFVAFYEDAETEE